MPTWAMLRSTFRRTLGFEILLNSKRIGLWSVSQILAAKSFYFSRVFRWTWNIKIITGSWVQTDLLTRLQFFSEFHFKQRDGRRTQLEGGPTLASKVEDRRPGEGACKDARREEQEVHSGWDYEAGNIQAKPKGTM